MNFESISSFPVHLKLPQNAHFDGFPKGFKSSRAFETLPKSIKSEFQRLKIHQIREFQRVSNPKNPSKQSFKATNRPWGWNHVPLIDPGDGVSESFKSFKGLQIRVSREVQEFQRVSKGFKSEFQRVSKGFKGSKLKLEVETRS